MKSPNKDSLFVATFKDGSDTEWETILPCKTSTYDRIVTSPSGLYLININDCCFVEPKLKRVTSFPWKPVNKYSALAFIDGKIFAFGGNRASKSVKSINLQESNPEWKSEQEMLHAVDRPHIVQIANKVYAFDGWRTTVTQEFDPASNEWRMRSQMPGDCYYGAAVALGDKIYVVGGEVRACYSYDPENDEWKVLSKPTHEYYNNAATVWRGRILIGNEKHVEEYDPVDDRWSNRDDLLPDGGIKNMILHASCTI
ncbi:hypothetical protein CAPTEDRAFT_195261 [Capitella teleta]|uniref:Uncharacterized protein n=1 Tax=Capitella teleta TaxID=283909 RepID=R7UJF5_CAPTE|nr:hypothetical protein CAPTEDRAFT_195261 [Capitella teleta]|eukprot:ELU03908.1 hypothetical protein CAPTEDRAFT_195261 [Capitella teleta]